MNTGQDSLSSIPNAIETRDALPRPDWELIAGWVDANTKPNSLNDAWTVIARDWLRRLARALPASYTILESPEFMVLIADGQRGERVLKRCERARRIILETLDGVARDEGFGKHVVLVFSDADSYYDYIVDFYPEEGEFALSGGMFINGGYGHFVICPTFDGDYERTIAHELNHALLSHLPLPLWLNEGVTQYMEDHVLGMSSFLIEPEIVRRHREYWNSETIHQFWSGLSFYSPDDGQELSYHLSRVLFRNLMSDFPEHVRNVLNKAEFEDAGNAAFVEECKVSLAERVTQFLGLGDWGPRADYDA